MAYFLACSREEQQSNTSPETPNSIRQYRANPTNNSNNYKPTYAVNVSYYSSNWYNSCPLEGLNPS